MGNGPGGNWPNYHATLPFIMVFIFTTLPLERRRRKKGIKSLSVEVVTEKIRWDLSFQN